MATATRKTRSAKTAAKAPAKGATRKARTAPASAKRTSKAAAPVAAKPARKEMVRRTEAQKIKLGKSIIARMKKGETMTEIATDLKLYPFQAHQLVALVHVDRGDVPKITGSTDEIMLKRLAVARAKGDEFSSWDWLQARSGVNKVKIKKMFDEAGISTGDVRASRRESAPARKPVAAKAKSARTRATAAKKAAAVSPAKPARTRKAAAPAPKPVSKRRAASNNRKVREAAKSPDAFDAKKAIDKGLAKTKAETPAKAKQAPRGAVKRQAERKVRETKAVATRKRRALNVPKGARPSAPDPS